MYSHKIDKICNVNIDKLFDIIIDIEQYPKFLPWCIAANILSRNLNNLRADLMISYQGINEQYTSKITYERPSNIEVVAVKGLFKALNNSWRLHRISENQTRVEFSIEFEFKSKILNHIIGLVYNKAISKITQAFFKRAELLSN